MATEVTEPIALDKTLQRVASALEQVAASETGGGVWGFIEDMDVKDPEDRIIYTGDSIGKTPMSLNSDGSVNEGGWADFIDQLNNHPWMVKSDGTPDYRLMDTDYTKKMDGTASDVANTDYDGGAFAWIRRIYKSEKMYGNRRAVSFRLTPAEGYEPVGFRDPNDNVLEGIWIPMFYGSKDSNGKMRSLSGMQPIYSNTTAQEYTAISAVGTRAAFYGGGIAETLTDILIMLCGSTDVPGVIGTGNCSGYDGSKSPTNGVLANACVGSGRWYGTTTGKALNKYFHSIVLGSYQQWQRDPYRLLINGTYYVSKNYTYDLTGAKYTKTDVTVPAAVSGVYPHYYKTVEGFGALPTSNGGYNGSSSTGGCDGFWTNITITAVLQRFANASNGLVCGPRACSAGVVAGAAGWDIGASLILLPPVGVAA